MRSEQIKRAVFLGIAIILGVIVSIVSLHERPETSNSHIDTSTVGEKTDFKDATYTIEGQPITLTDGHAKTSVRYAPDESPTTVETDYFGNSVLGDFDGDGTTDAVLLLTQNPGGSGTFYYAALALGTESGGYAGANAIFLGDRIAPQTLTAKNNLVTVTYLDRGSDEPMSTQPTIPTVKEFKVTNRQLIEITQQ